MSNYECMYLIPRDIYDRFLVNIMNEQEKKKVEKLNTSDIGNESGAFPDLPENPSNNTNTPSSHNTSRNNLSNTSTSNNDDDDDDDNDDERMSPERNSSTVANFSTPSSSNSELSSPFISPIRRPQSNNFYTIPGIRRLDELSSDEDSHISKERKKKKKSKTITNEVLPQQNFVPFQSTSDMSNNLVPTLSVNNQSVVSDRGVRTENNLPSLSSPTISQKSKNKTSKSQLTQKSLNQSAKSSSIEATLPKSISLEATSPKSSSFTASSSTENVNLHKKTKQKKFVCSICKEIFGYVKDLNTHLIKKHKEKSNKKVYPNWSKEKNINPLSSDDDEMNIVSSSKNVLSSDDEVMNKTSENLIDFNSDNENEIHQTVTIPDSEGYFYDNYDISAKQCKLCPGYFNSDKNLERHIKNVHSADKNYVSWIDHGIKRKSSKVPDDNTNKISKKKKYDYNTEKPEFFCELCDMSFTNNKSLERHQKNIHRTDKDYVSWIPQGTKRKINEVTNRDKPTKRFSKFLHKCKLCTYTFSKEDALTRHIKNIHSADKKYVSDLQQGEKRKRN